MEESFCRINIGWEEKDQCFNTWTIGPTLNIDFVIVVIIVDFRLHSTLGRKTPVRDAIKYNCSILRNTFLFRLITFRWQSQCQGLELSKISWREGGKLEKIFLEMPFSVGFNFFRPEVGGKDREEVSSKGETLEA